MTYFSLHISRIHKDLEDLRILEENNKKNTENKKTTEKNINFKSKMKKNGSMDDFIKIQWPWLF